MSPIKSKQVLHRTIKETIWNCPEDNIEFPRVIHFCDGLGEPTFKITIEKLENDSFVDSNGIKWIRANE